MKLLSLCVPSLVFSMFVGGCHIENHHEDVEGRADGDTCGTYCLHLYECASIADSQLGSCLDECNVRLRFDTAATVSACECVLGDECRALGEYDCPGAPMPGAGAGTGGGSGGTSAGASGGSSAGSPATGGTTSGVGGSSGTAGGPALGCHGGYECGDGEDCVDGACRRRCTASCQCPTDLSCIDHYCRSASPPAMCSTDCECASGQHCLSGFCG